MYARHPGAHILLVTPYYWPEIAASVPLMRAVAEGLCQEGMRVTVLSSSTREPLPAEDVISLDPQKAPTLIRAWNPFTRRRSLAGKLMEFLWFFIQVMCHGLLVDQVDAIFVSSSPPLAGLPVALLGWLKDVPVVYNLQDLFPESAVASGLMRRNGFAFSGFTWLEHGTYRAVSKVIAISEEFARHVEKLAPGCPVTVIPNWVDTEALTAVPEEKNRFLPLLPDRKPFRVLYAGNLGYLQNLDLLLDAASLLQDEPAIQFLLVGDGSQKAALKARAERKGLDNCVFMDFQPYALLADVYSACQIGVVPMRPGAGQSSVPSKTWNYLACGKPVIACVEPETPFARLLQASGAGRVVSPSDPQALAATLREAMHESAQAQRWGESGRQFVETHLSKRSAVNRYADAIREVLGK